MRFFFATYIKFIHCVCLVLLSFSSHVSLAAVTSCGSGNSLVYMEQKVASTTLPDVTNRTIPVSQSINYTIHWYYATRQHPTSRWYVEVMVDSASTNTGVRLSVDSFNMGPIFIGSYPIYLSLGQHIIKSKLVFEDGRTCELSTPYRVEAIDTVGQISSIDKNGLVLGCAHEKGRETGASTVVFNKPSVNFYVGGVSLGSVRANTSVPSSASSICPAGTGFSFILTPKQVSDFCGSYLSASVNNVSLGTKGIPCPQSGKLENEFTGLCFTRPPGSVIAGQRIFLTSCDDRYSMPLNLRPSDQNLEIANRDGWCVHPEGGSSNPVDGTGLVVWPSCGESRLAFELTSTGLLKHVPSGKCVLMQSPFENHILNRSEAALQIHGECNQDWSTFKFL